MLTRAFTPCYSPLEGETLCLANLFANWLANQGSSRRNNPNYWISQGFFESKYPIFKVHASS